MSRKSQGIAKERELIHLLWAREYAAIRVAGSGSSRYPSCDILASNGERTFAFECKSVKDGARYIPRQDIEDFVTFATKFGAQPWIAVRFAGKEWHFVLIEDLKQTPSGVGITKEIARTKGLLIDELLN